MYRSSDPSARSVAEPQVIRRMQRLAIVLGFASILAAGLTGWSAYNVSRSRLLESYYEDLLGHARTGAAFLATKPIVSLDASALSELETQFTKQGKTWPGSYLCVIDRDGKLLLHTRDPSKVGLTIGGLPFSGRSDEDPAPTTLLELLSWLKSTSSREEAAGGHDGWIGRYTSVDGETQMAAFAYAPTLEALVAVHVPWKEVERRVLLTTLPWAIGLGLTVLMAVPLALWGLSKAYADTERGAEQAREAERRSAEQVRMLREIDRAILAGGSVEEIVRGALARLSPLVHYYRASVTLYDHDRGVARILAVQSPSGTQVRPGAEVPLAELGVLGFENLKEGQASVIADLDAAGELPAFMKQLRAEGVRSTAKIPLTCRGELLGTLNVSFDRVGGPPAEDLELAQEVADVLALAVLQARLRAELEEQAAELERRVEERTRQLSEVNSELEGYVRSVSHDLRAPLRAVHGFGNLLLEEAGGKLGKTEREYLERMVSASGRMDALVRDLLTYSRLAREDVAVRALDLQHVVEEAQDILQIELDQKKAVIEVAPPILPVFGHHSSLVQAIVNLLSNAAKFVAPGVQPRIRVRTEARGDCVRVWVEDNGIGIPARDSDKVFRMFERLNGSESYPGTGIGLAIVRRSVERMGGAAGVESTPGEGSRFWIDLPREKPER